MAIARSSRLYLLTISLLALVCSSCGVCTPRYFINSISPGNTSAGGNQFVLTVKGSDFRRDSLVSWNGSFRVTTLVSSHQLEAAITATDIAQPGMVLVFVFNPGDEHNFLFGRDRQGHHRLDAPARTRMQFPSL